MMMKQVNMVNKDVTVTSTKQHVDMDAPDVQSEMKGKENVTSVDRDLICLNEEVNNSINDRQGQDV
eukprot:15367153-Ditylum_brightwellii.AAC.1